DHPVKLLGDGALEVKGLKVSVDAASRVAAEAINAAGGELTLPEGVEVSGTSDDAVVAAPEGAEAEAAEAKAAQAETAVAADAADAEAEAEEADDSSTSEDN